MFRNITNKSRAMLVGIFILVAYGVLASAMTQSKIIVMLADVISGLAVIGIAVLMFPLFKNLDKSLSRGYLILKYAEAILMILGGLLFFIDSTQYLRDIIYESFHIYVFIVSGFMFYLLLFKSKLVPRFISIWGAAGLFAILVSTLLNLVNIQYAFLDYFLVLIITNEVFLAIWLMVKGFNKSIINNYQIS
jgi:hypothetical protein